VLYRFVAAIAGIAASLAFAVVGAGAAEYPMRPVTLIVAFTPGGPSDVLARILGKRLHELFGQPFVIDNRPGAAGNIAAEAVANAAPDGYTLLMGNNSILATNASLYKKLNYDPQRDFAPISLIGSQANILVVNPSVPANSMQELIALAKSRPGQLNRLVGAWCRGASCRRAVQGGSQGRHRARRLQGRRSCAARRGRRACADDVRHRCLGGQPD
jgi:tripartite-type tricarboxylate transporter receptor subunit TctC